MKTRINWWLLAGAVVINLPTYAQQGHTPPCSEVKQVKLDTDTLKTRVLNDFIKACLANNSFNSLYDKGIIHLHEYTNSQGELCWLLVPTIQDSYKDNPPTRFSDYDGDIILLYDADSTGRVTKTKGDISSLNRCLEQIIGDRVFIRPLQRSRWTSSVMPVSNRKRNEGNRRNELGNGGSVIIIFDKNGGYRKTFPA